MKKSENYSSHKSRIIQAIVPVSESAIKKAGKATEIFMAILK